MKTIRAKPLRLSSKSIKQLTAVVSFLFFGCFLIFGLLSVKIDESKSRNSQTIKTLLQQKRPSTDTIMNQHTVKSFPLEPLLSGKGIGTIRAIKTEPSHDCTLGTDGPLLISPVCAAQDDLTLVILVTSAPGHLKQRRAIRNTWGRRRHISNTMNNALKGTSQAWRTIFMIGSTSNISMQVQIEEEARLEGDIILGDYVDHYRNLTVKVQQGLCWAMHNCNAKYVLKTDDDCFVNTELFTQFLEKYNEQKTKLYAGYSMKTLDVIRTPLNKWHVSRQLYPKSHYPPYASGTGYVVSRDVLQLMVQKASDVQYFPMEDAYTGVLANNIGVRLRDTNRFVLNNVNWGVCNYLYLLVIHQVSPEQQYLGLMYSEDALDPEKCPQMDEYTNWI